MKHMTQLLAAQILCIALSCAGSMAEETLAVRSNGLVSWESVEGVNAYLCLIFNRENETVDEWIFPDPYCYLLDECRMEVYAFSDEGERGELLYTTDYYTENSQNTETYDDLETEMDDEASAETYELGNLDPETGDHYVDFLYSVKFEDLMEYDVVANIDESSVRRAADGSIEFETNLPNGSRMRFFGTGVTYKDGNLVFAQDGMLTALDAIGRYILIDLLTDGGVNGYDASDFGLDGVHGVRISHVNSHMEKRVLTGGDGVEYPIGTIHTANTYNPEGKYLLEVIRAGGKNTFTALDDSRKTLTKDDLFGVGDVFSVDTYSEFFTDGLMDDGSEFGYTVEIARIDQDADGAYTATIRITRK